MDYSSVTKADLIRPCVLNSTPKKGGAVTFFLAFLQNFECIIRCQGHMTINVVSN